MTTTSVLNFANSESNLKRRIDTFFAQSAYPGLRRISVATSDGAVTLAGQVSSFYEKQLSLHLAARVAGERQVIDAIVVDSQHATGFDR